MLPAMNELSPFTKNLVSNPIAIHFIHRGLAYVLVVLMGIWWFKSRAIANNKLFNRLRLTVVLLVLLQALLGILTVLNATYSNRLVALGVSHQFVAMILLMVIVSLLFVVRKKETFA
jgi:cytochrome c oxidase assembly protein subunit 15